MAQKLALKATPRDPKHILGSYSIVGIKEKFPKIWVKSLRVLESTVSILLFLLLSLNRHLQNAWPCTCQDIR